MPLVLMQDVQSEPLNWLWPGYILFGKLTMLDGDGGLGKSTVMLDMAARLSRGRALPDGIKHEPCGTLLLMAEDGAGDTIKPRLENAGADMTRIALLQTYTDPVDQLEVMPTFPDDIAIIETAIETVGARLLVVDPLLSYLGEGVNEYRDKEVRRALTPLIAMAQRTGVALVCLRHVTKMGSANAKHRGNGSVAFTNMARSALFAAPDPDDRTRFVLAQSKTNLGPAARSLVYRLLGCENGHARVSWEGVSPHTADMLSAQGQNDEDRSELGEAKDFLAEVLARGPVLVKAVEKEATAAGIASATLRRAKNALGVKSDKEQKPDGLWRWYIPAPAPIEGDREGDHDHLTRNVDHLDHLDHLHSSTGKNGHAPDVIALKLLEDDQGDQETGHENVITFDAPENIPRAATSGPGYDCAVCGAPIKFAMKGLPLLCKVHKGWYTTMGLVAD